MLEKTLNIMGKNLGGRTAYGGNGEVLIMAKLVCFAVVDDILGGNSSMNGLVCDDACS
jgi:hypothetical protein